jgi:phage gpG-like protein
MLEPSLNDHHRTARRCANIEDNTLNFSSLASFAAHIAVIKHDTEKVQHEIIRKACQMVFAEARRVLGTEGCNWPALSPATEKTQPGMLLESGEMRDSIQWSATGNEGRVGSDLDKAVWHELGTLKIPPRSFLAGAAHAMAPAIHKMAARAVMAVLGGRGLHTSEFGELLHQLKHAYHEVKELAMDVLEPDEGNHR